MNTFMEEFGDVFFVAIVGALVIGAYMAAIQGLGPVVVRWLDSLALG